MQCQPDKISIFNLSEASVLIYRGFLLLFLNLFLNLGMGIVDENTGVCMMYDLKTKSLLIEFRDLYFELKPQDIRDLSVRFSDNYLPNSLANYNFAQMIREEIIILIVTKWLNSK